MQVTDKSGAAPVIEDDAEEEYEFPEESDEEEEESFDAGEGDEGDDE